MSDFDLLIKNGSIIDGSGSPAYTGDIGIKGDCITATGNLSAYDAPEIIDASQMAVTPGFIDVHTHSDFTLLINPAAESQVHQGVTLEIVGNCGYSCAPVSDPDLLAKTQIGYDPSVDISWRSMEDYLKTLSSSKPGLNVMSFVGHAALRQVVMGAKTKNPNKSELNEMLLVLEQALEEGAVGLSTGLEYWPGANASYEELFELCKMVKKYNAVHSVHMRNRDVMFDYALAEVLSLSRKTGVKTQISHIQPKYGVFCKAMERTLTMVDWAREDGLEIYIDVIPSRWAHTMVTACLPQWAFDGGIKALKKRLQDKNIRKGLKANPNCIWQLIPDGKWNDIVLLKTMNFPELHGKTFVEIGQILKRDPYDAALDILLEEGENMGQAMWTAQNFKKDDIYKCLAKDYCMIVSDTMAVAPYGRLKNVVASVSGYGWVANFLEKYILEGKILSPEEAVFRLSALPALTFNIKKRGFIKPSYFADINIINLKELHDRSDLNNLFQSPRGFEYLIVNGKIQIAKSKRLPVNNGHVIRYSAN